ncbi:hypothetical protein V3851_22270 [Paenibacillus sp. M1]|uniref:DUF1433 domain-containing protein n=1 Tax=Paenibacillus haidiansis TaxID=1574488 RepID=A0ABU7VZ82_9BACL
MNKSADEQEEIIRKAEQVGIQYFKENYNVDVVFTKFDIDAPHVSSDVAMYGHIKGEEDQEILLLVSYRTYEVTSGLYPEGFFEKHPPLKESN